MSAINPPFDLTAARAGAALTPSPHDIEVAAASTRMLGPLSEAKGDLQLTVTGEDGVTGQLCVPASALHLLFAALAEMACGNPVTLLPLNTELTTQQAADILNVSRPYLVGLLERGDMPFRKVGVQRRVQVRDVMTYKVRSDIDRRTALTELAQLGQEVGIGYDV